LLERRAARHESYGAPTPVIAAHHLAVDGHAAVLALADERRAAPDALARMNERLPLAGAGIDDAGEQALDAPATGVPPADQTGGKHPRVIHHEHIVGPEPRREISHDADSRRARDAVEAHQPRGAALGRRLLGDAVVGQFEVEVGDLHASPALYGGPRCMTYCATGA